MADERRTAEYTLQELVDMVVSERMSGTLSAGSRATAVWLAANGDIERAHTTGVYLRDARVAGQPPVMGVYLDNRMRVVDFSANKDLYIARVINQGLQISDIEFKLDRKGRSPLGVSSKKAQTDTVTDTTLPELTPEELARVQELTQNLPETIREVAQKAVILSFRREKLLETRK